MKAGDLMAEALSPCGARRQELHSILAEIIHCNKLEIPLLRDKELSGDQVEKFRRFSRLLLEGVPLQHVLGKAWFYGLEFTITPDVLIPRPETEGLVELALMRAKAGMNILEIGAGSGCVSVALKKNLPGLRVTATESSPQAFEIAKRNAARHSCEVDLRLCDLFPDGDEVFNLIVSNPPYIAGDEYAGLELRVREHEPREALLAREGGLEYYRRILRDARPRLAGEGLILFEHGAGQRQAVEDIAASSGFSTVYAGADLAGRDRYLVFGKRPA